MAKTVAVIGIEDGELRWVRSLIELLRHPDPSIPELARQALLYLARSAADRPLGISAPAAGLTGPDDTALPH
ncbi:MAG TPA: hypothetical protein VMU19_06080 [Bryobacteraceae bacterium]|nr:hypothetical protein [Bryobacteraceae bacterium]